MVQQLGLSVFNNDTWAQFQKSGMHFLGHKTQVHVMVEKDIVLLYNKQTKSIHGFGILKVIENGKIYRKFSLLDPQIYSGSYAKYNNFEIGVKTYLIDPIKVEEIMKQIGLDSSTQLVPGHVISFKRILEQYILNKLTPWVHGQLLQAMIAEAVK